MSIDPKNTIPILRVASGPSRGQDFTLEANEIVIDKRIIIYKKGNQYLLKSMTFSEVMINGEAFMEAILEKNDKIITENSEYLFVVRDPLADAKKRKLVVVGGAALIVALLLLTIPVLLPIHKNVKSITASTENNNNSVLASNSQTISSIVYDTGTMAAFAVQDLLAEQINKDLTVPQTEEEYDIALAQARLRFQIAETYANDSSQGLGNLFWAIQQWQMIVNIFKDFDPPPAIVAKSMENVKTHQAILDRRKQHFILIAKLAGARGDVRSQIDALDALVNLLQVESGPNSEDFAKAQLQLLEITQSLQKQKAKK